MSAEIAELLALDVEVWFRTCARILDKDAELIRPEPNILQTRVFNYYRECQIAGKPCLVMILKPRQKGASTTAEAVIYHHMRRLEGVRGFLMGDISATSEKVFEMFRRYAQLDQYQWAGMGVGDDNIMPGCEKADELTLRSGSKFYMETAGSSNAGRGGTVQVAHFDEEAHYPFSNVRDPMLAALPSVNKTSGKSLIFRTSTPNGSSGTFYDDWFGKNPYKKIFAAWFEFADSQKGFSCKEERDEFAAKLTQDEQEELARFKGRVTLEHLNWRRYTIETDCKGDPQRFRQEYPSDEISCFMTSSRPRYCQDALMKMRHRVESDPSRERGSIVVQANDTGAIWISDPEGDVTRFEEVRFGCHYLISVDTCSGEDQHSGKTPDPDYHDVQVWRRGYFDPARNEYRVPKIVMRHRSRVDSDILVDIVVGMSLMHGKCLVVPEVNGEAGLHLIKMLVSRQIPVFRRAKVSDGRDDDASGEKKLEPYGWRTTESMRKMVVDSMVKPVRDMEIDLSDPEVVGEFQRFVTNKKGKAEAMRGFHDDAVLSACIGHYCLPGATEYRMPYRRNVNLRKLKRDPTYLAPDGWKRDIGGNRSGRG